MSITDIINSILEDNSKNDNNSNPTFLSVIRRDYDEDLISRIVAYALSIDSKFIENLFNDYINDKKNDWNIDFSNLTSNNISVVCEKFMGKGRADIFVEIKNKEKTIATITIENKIYSHEHDNQTQTYYDWVMRNYKDCYNIFFYLRPGYNYSKASCNDYVNITYKKLQERITIEKDIIIEDFKKHIEQMLGDRNMTLEENDIDIINNYDKIMNAINSAKKKLKEKQDSLIQKIENNLSEKYKISDWKSNLDESFLRREIINHGVGIQSYRLYKKDWYLEKNYYFYIEIKFENGKLDDIYLQETVRDDSNNKNLISKFVKKESLVDYSGQYCVITQSRFENCSWTDDNWEDSFVEFATDKIREYIADMDKVFNNYIKEKEEANN